MQRVFSKVIFFSPNSKLQRYLWGHHVEIPYFLYIVRQFHGSKLLKPVVKVQLIDPAQTSFHFAKRIVNQLINFVEETTHMDEVRKSQQKVLQIQDDLRDSEDRKRKLLSELEAIRMELRNITKRMPFCDRNTDQFLEFLEKELKLSQDEKKKRDEYNSEDELNRQLLNDIVISIKDSYEKEKVHANILRALGLIGTLVVSLITLLSTIIANNRRREYIEILEKHTTEIKKNVVQEIVPVKQLINEIKGLLIRGGSIKIENQQKESWTTYFKRHTGNVYRYIFHISSSKK